MTGFNLPPGVTTSMIPGNRPEDELWEREAEKFCRNCHRNSICHSSISISECYMAEEFEKQFAIYLEEI